MRYVLHPGYVRSQNDHDEHFIGGSNLCRLYGVSIRDCVFGDTQQYRERPGDVHLYPRRDGNYTLAGIYPEQERAMEKFTASEVRVFMERYKSGDVAWGEADDYLKELADLLEAQEKAVPVAWRTFDGEGNYDYRDYENNEHYRDWYVSRNGAKYANWVEPLYSHPTPSDAERLAEALRCALTWIEVAPHADSCGDADAYNHTELRSCGCGKDAIVENLTEALAAHSTQAQPPAASVTDSMVERGLKACIQDSDARLPRYKVVRSIIEAALAAQENPNG